MPNFIIISVYADGLSPLGATIFASKLTRNPVSLICIKRYLDGKTITGVIGAANLVNADDCIAIIDLNEDPKAGMMYYLVQTVICDIAENVDRHQTTTDMATNISIRRLQWIWDWFGC